MRIKLLIGLLVLGGVLIVISIFFIAPIRTPSLVGKEPTCKPDKEKDKVAIVIAKGGLYDVDIINSQILAYYQAVKKDLQIGNVGLKKFDGVTIGELENFIDELYLKEDVAYAILVGDDLPVADVTEDDATNLHAIYLRLECVNGDCRYGIVCSDLAISYILPPVFYLDDNKIDFILKILENYTNYHNNFAIYDDKYQNSVLYIKAEYPPDVEVPPSERIENIRKGYNLPIISVLNTEYEKVRKEMKNKHMVLYYSCGVHGSPTSVGLGLSYAGKTISLEQYLDFVKENGLPALFVEADTCGSTVIKEDGINYCCWPQTYMESGIWAYYTFGGGATTEIPRMQKAFSNEKIIGLAIRKNIIGQALIFGDILAHMK